MFIQQSFIKLIIFLLLFSCKETRFFDKYPQGVLLTKTNKELQTFIAHKPSHQEKGLSTVKPEQFKDNEVMLFTGSGPKVRQFWMPETFFDLDIVFLTKDLYVIDVHRNVPHHKARYPRHEVPLSRAVRCTHVLEIKSSSPLAKEIKVGEFLKWKLKNLDQILQDTH